MHVRARTRDRGRTSSGEPPVLIAGLKAWFDARLDAYFAFSTGSQISAWGSRLGSLGPVALQQGTSANQPLRATAVATLNSQNAVQFDGIDDYLDTTSQNVWKFLHDGTGASCFRVWRIDSTGGATQRLGQNSTGNTQDGVFWGIPSGNLQLLVHNGTGVTLNSWASVGSGHGTRDVSRWWLWGYVAGAQHSRISGSSLTNVDVGGQVPSTANPDLALRIGASPTATAPLKGYIAQDIYFDRVLSATEVTQLATWANGIYGVAI